MFVFLKIGATGFVGSFFLSHLLSSDDKVSVHCLIRCDNEREGVCVLFAVVCV